MSERNYTKEELEELKKCLDPRTGQKYFIEKYFRIEHPTKGPVKLELSKYHHDALNRWVTKKFCIDLVAVQMGKRTLEAAYALWCLVFMPNFCIGGLSNTQANAIDLVQRIRYGYEYLPEFLKPKLVEDCKKSLKFDNCSRIIASTTTACSLKGMTCSLVIFDEAGQVNDSIFDDVLMALMPVIATSTGGMIIATTKPEEGHPLLRVWEDSYSNNGSFDAEIYPYTYNGPMEDERKTVEVLRLGKQRFDREYMCK